MTEDKFITWDDILSISPDVLFAISIDCSHDKVISANPFQKKITVFDDSNNNAKVLSPEHFYLKYDGKTIIEW